ncbi:TPA: hypothetical protein QFB97_001252 [Enterococcus faecium]|nr:MULTISPECIES: hypothetical protein [Enterococcus]
MSKCYWLLLMIPFLFVVSSKKEYYSHIRDDPVECPHYPLLSR